MTSSTKSSRTARGTRSKPLDAERLAPLDTITASLVARQSRSDDGSMSVDDQLTAMREWCAKQTPPVIVGAEYVERDVSGRRPLEKRHGLHAAVVDVEEGRAQMTLTAYFDRMVRSTQTRAEAVTRIEKAGGVAMTLDMGVTSNATAMSKLQGNMLASIAEFYADQIGEKTHAPKQRAIDNGIPPFGNYTPAYVKGPDGTLVPSEHHALVREACMLRIGGNGVKPKSLAEVTRFLRDSGLDITRVGVKSMFRSRLLCGEIHFGKFKPNLDAIEQPVLTKSEFRKLDATHAPRGRNGKSDELLARQDVLVCDSCDSHLCVNTTTLRGKTYSYYRCGNRDTCDAPVGIRVEIADDAVRDAAIEWSASFKGRASLDRDVAKAEAELTNAQTKLDKAMRLFMISEDESEAKRIVDEATAARDVCATQLHRLRLLSAPSSTVRTTDDWDRMTLDGKRAVIHATIKRAVVIASDTGAIVEIETRTHR